MALGARKSTILSQFIFETLVITLVGGILASCLPMHSEDRAAVRR